METCPLGLQTPDFGGDAEVRRHATRGTPRGLFRALLSPEDHIGHFEPAYRFACAALDRAAADAEGLGDDTEPQRFVARLMAWAESAAESAAYLAPPERFVSTWPLRVARELAPVALTDGAWLEGAVRANVVESRVGMLLLRQMMIRFGDPGTRESYAERYAQFLRSMGIVPVSIARWERDEAAPCADISYEHCLLGLSLRLFPSVLFPETVGFNLWAALFGPCRLLSRLKAHLPPGACTRYFDLYDSGALQALATQAAHELLQGPTASLLRARLARGFIAAHRAHQRWEQAMCSGTIPVTAEQAVVETIQHKALFAAGHHTALVMGGDNVADLMQGDERSRQRLLHHLAGSPLITPGQPEQSPFLTQTLSVNGPMFEAFTATEIQELREWVTGLTQAPQPIRQAQRVEPEGDYHAPQDVVALRRYGQAQYSAMAPHALLFHFINADRYPAARAYARCYAEAILSRIDAALSQHPLLAAEQPPEYSQEAVATLVAQHHERNVKWRQQPSAILEAHWQRVKPAEPLFIPLDGCWLQGFADVYRSAYEEYGWLFRIYASEQGDGNLDWNHNRIYRLCFSADDVKATGATTSPEIFAAYCNHFLGRELMKAALSLHTEYFLPELLGLNLANEASGVGSTYHYYAQRFAEAGNLYRALDFSLHNSIDNFAAGHTKWSLSAVQAFMERVQAVAPALRQSHWRRIWRFLRLGQVFDHGTEEEKRALGGLWLAPCAVASP